MITSPRVRLADLPARKGAAFAIEPGQGELEEMARRLGARAVRKLRFEGRIEPFGAADWRLTGRLGATAVQECVVTLDPVTTRVDEAVAREYVAHYEEPEDGSETEMPQTESEPLPAVLDLLQVAEEALAVALPDYPRADGAGLGEAVFAEPGVEPMTDEQARPFAGLASLRDKLGGGD